MTSGWPAGSDLALAWFPAASTIVARREGGRSTWTRRGGCGALAAATAAGAAGAAQPIASGMARAAGVAGPAAPSSRAVASSTSSRIANLPSGVSGTDQTAAAGSSAGADRDGRIVSGSAKNAAATADAAMEIATWPLKSRSMRVGLAKGLAAVIDVTLLR
jgi:hypothetical protein